jgi:Protein of unknown function (DUF3568)
MKPDRLVPAFHSLLYAALVAVVSFSALSGCVAVAVGAGAGVVAYVRGDLETTLPNDYDQVVNSVREAVKTLEFVKVSDSKDAFKGVLIARTALDKKIVIDFTNAGKNLTNIKIRVGVFGDEQMSLAILEKIKNGL